MQQGLIKSHVVRFMSLHLWGLLPGITQRWLSSIYATIYETRLSRVFVWIYCRFVYQDRNYLTQFQPASGATGYKSFQDFFTRVYKSPPIMASDSVWSCEGYFCDYGQVQTKDTVRVKGETRHLRTIFGAAGPLIPETHYFANVFLHNSHYHRIHAPVRGFIRRIERIPGELLLLRPWVYRGAPSLPALTNERVNVDIEDSQGRTWFLSIVGGPAVGTIVMDNLSRLGNEIQLGQEIGHFLMGSTCCIASPEPITQAKVGDQVQVGQALN